MDESHIGSHPRNFPAMDESGLCDPCYELQVADKTVSCVDVPPSLNPTYIQRVVIPIE